MRVGLGYDLHRLEAGRSLILGGVRIPFEKGLAGHSDGDAVAHAITDALLGAAAIGDIGRHFPDTDPAYKDADSLALLRSVSEKVRAQGYSIANVDANVVAQTPKLSPHIDTIRATLAACLELDTRFVSVKTKTNEGLGPEGRGEAISVQAIALLETGAD